MSTSFRDFWSAGSVTKIILSIVAILCVDFLLTMYEMEIANGIHPINYSIFEFAVYIALGFAVGAYFANLKSRYLVLLLFLIGLFLARRFFAGDPLLDTSPETIVGAVTQLAVICASSLAAILLVSFIGGNIRYGEIIPTVGEMFDPDSTNTVRAGVCSLCSGVVPFSHKQYLLFRTMDVKTNYIYCPQCKEFVAGNPLQFIIVGAIQAGLALGFILLIHLPRLSTLVFIVLALCLLGGLKKVYRGVKAIKKV